MPRIRITVTAMNDDPITVEEFETHGLRLDIGDSLELTFKDYQNEKLIFHAHSIPMEFDPGKQFTFINLTFGPIKVQAVIDVLHTNFSMAGCKTMGSFFIPNPKSAFSPNTP